MTEADWTELLGLLHKLYLCGRVILMFIVINFGCLVFLAYRKGRV